MTKVAYNNGIKSRQHNYDENALLESSGIAQFFLPHIQCLYNRFYATLVIKFVLRRRCSILAILVVNHFKFHGRLTSLASLQYQHTGYSNNLVGVVSPYQPWRTPPLSNLIIFFMFLFRVKCITWNRTSVSTNGSQFVGTEIPIGFVLFISRKALNCTLSIIISTFQA